MTAQFHLPLPLAIALLTSVHTLILLSFTMLFAAILQLLLSYEVSAFLAGRTASSSSTFLFRVQQTATDDIITATNNEGALDNSATSDIHHAVIGYVCLLRSDMY